VCVYVRACASVFVYARMCVCSFIYIIPFQTCNWLFLQCHLKKTWLGLKKKSNNNKQQQTPTSVEVNGVRLPNTESWRNLPTVQSNIATDPGNLRDCGHVVSTARKTIPKHRTGSQHTHGQHGKTRWGCGWGGGGGREYTRTHTHTHTHMHTQHSTHISGCIH
jgi:hypothetical protein